MSTGAQHMAVFMGPERLNSRPDNELTVRSALRAALQDETDR